MIYLSFDDERLAFWACIRCGYSLLAPSLWWNTSELAEAVSEHGRECEPEEGWLEAYLDGTGWRWDADGDDGPLL